MLQIIGFGEVVRFAKGLHSQKEMRVIGPDGTEHGIPVSEEVVQRLLDIYVNSEARKPVPFVRPQAPAAPPAATSEEESPDVGEVVPGDAVAVLPKSGDEHGTPIHRGMPKPKFLDDDEDGQQI